MALVLTQWQAYGVYRDEPLTEKVAFQVLRLVGTAANTDVTYDLGTYAGTFWNAVDATATGLAALAAIKDIQTRAQTFLQVTGSSLAGKSLQDSSRSVLQSLDSAASVGGAAAETYTVTGLLTTDDVKSVVQFQKGANAAYIVDFGGATGQPAANNALVVEYNTDVGAGAKVRVAFVRTVTTPDAGGYQLAMDGTNTKLPNITFASGDAPTAFELVLYWALKDGEQPIKASGAA